MNVRFFEGSILTWGDFIFKSTTIPITSIQKDESVKWSSFDRAKNSSARMWQSDGNNTINVEGVIFPEYSPAEGIQGNLSGPTGRFQLDTLRSMQLTKIPYLLIDGTGVIFGKYILTKISQTQDKFLHNGIPRKQSYNLTFEKYSGDQQIKKSLLNRARGGVSDGQDRLTDVIGKAKIGI
jgi:uncharacterized protein